MSDSDVYIAEKILSKRRHKGQVQYLIKWKGYSMKESTWEPVGNIICPSLLTSFENRRGAKRTKNNSSQRSTQQSRASERQATPTSTATPTPEPKPPTPAPRATKVPTPETVHEPPTLELHSRTPTPDARSKPQTPKASASPLAQSTSSARTPDNHASPRPHSNQTIPSSPGIKTLNHDSPVSTPKLPQRSQTPINSTQTPVMADEQAQTRVTTAIQVYKPQVTVNARPEKPKNRKFAVMNTVITDITVNNHTITICESKTNQGFFREGNSVDATTQF